MIGRVTGSEIKKNRDGDKKVVLLQVEITDPDDIQTVQSMGAAGVNSNPVNDSIVFIAQAGNAFKIAVAVDDGIEPTAKRGEYEIYSSKDGVKKSSAYCDEDGNLILNFGTDFAVRFSELKAAFDQLKADYDQSMVVVSNHSHNDSLGAPTTTPLLPSPPFPTPGIQPTTADIDPAKIDDIMVPGVTP